jgi:hypothetical protein
MLKDDTVKLVREFYDDEIVCQRKETASAKEHGKVFTNKMVTSVLVT